MVQAYAVFMFVWKFIVPLSVFTVSFSKILAVIRRQAKVMPSTRRKITVKPAGEVSTVAPTKSATTVIGSIFDLSQREKELGSNGQRKPENRGVSHTEINIIKTMMFIVSCFTVCWMPKTFDMMYMKLVVRPIKIVFELITCYFSTQNDKSQET